MGKVSRQVTVYVVGETREAIERLAQEEDRTITAWVRRAIKHELEREGYKPDMSNPRTVMHPAEAKQEEGEAIASEVVRALGDMGDME